MDQPPGRYPAPQSYGKEQWLRPDAQMWLQEPGQSNRLPGRKLPAQKLQNLLLWKQFSPEARPPLLQASAGSQLQKAYVPEAQKPQNQPVQNGKYYQ